MPRQGAYRLRYIPTVYSTTPLGGASRSRNGGRASRSVTRARMVGQFGSTIALPSGATSRLRATHELRPCLPPVLPTCRTTRALTSLSWGEKSFRAGCRSSCLTTPSSTHRDDLPADCDPRRPPLIGGAAAARGAPRVLRGAAAASTAATVSPPQPPSPRSRAAASPGLPSLRRRDLLGRPRTPQPPRFAGLFPHPLPIPLMDPRRDARAREGCQPGSSAEACRLPR
jgi:hypothetical protein